MIILVSWSATYLYECHFQVSIDQPQHIAHFTVLPTLLYSGAGQPRPRFHTEVRLHFTELKNGERMDIVCSATGYQ